MIKISGKDIHMRIEELLPNIKSPQDYLHCIRVHHEDIVGYDGRVVGSYSLAFLHDGIAGKYIVLTNRPVPFGDTGVVYSGTNFKEAKTIFSNIVLEGE